MTYFFSALRSIFCLFAIPLWVIVWGTLAIITCFIFRGNYFPTFFTVNFSKVSNFLAGIKVKVSGQENIPNSSALFVFNHTSLMDIPVINAHFTNDLRFGAKSSLFNVPIFGQALSAVGTIKVFRGDREKVIKEYNKSLVKVKNDGVSIILSAEGGRNGFPPALLPFKSGPFILAIQGQIPIVPIILTDAHKVLPKKTLTMPFGPWTRPVGLKILKPISTEGLTFDDRHKLKKETFTAMDNEIL